jgi:hypothetical protein
MLSATGAVHPQALAAGVHGSTNPTREPGRDGTALTSEISSMARSPARPRSPRWPPQPCELDGAHTVASGARETDHRHPWWSGGAGGRQYAIPSQKMVTGRVLEYRWAKASKMRPREGEKVGRRGGVHEAEISSELGHAPASNARWRGPYHGKLTGKPSKMIMKMLTHVHKVVITFWCWHICEGVEV